MNIVSYIIYPHNNIIWTTDILILPLYTILCYERKNARTFLKNHFSPIRIYEFKILLITLISNSWVLLSLNNYDHLLKWRHRKKVLFHKNYKNFLTLPFLINWGCTNYVLHRIPIALRLMKKNKFNRFEYADCIDLKESRSEKIGWK